MVKRYYVGNDGLVSHPTGTWVSLADYLALQAALREALDGWKLYDDIEDGVAHERIAALRAQFLDDK